MEYASRVSPMLNSSVNQGGLRCAGGRPNSRFGVPLVSVVTVVYNGAEHLEETILSVVGQDYEAVEYIIVDGGSVDGTLDIIKRYESGIDYWVSEPDNGISDAFNKGIRLCTGTWIGIINADDWYESDAVGAIAGSAQGDIAYGDMQIWDGNTKRKIHESTHSRLGRLMSIGHPSVFVRRDAYDRFGSYDASYDLAMDYEFLLRAWMAGAVFQRISRTLANFRSGGASSGGEYHAIAEVRRAKVQHHVNNRLTNDLDYFRAIVKCFAARKLGVARAFGCGALLRRIISIT